mmetsp:Transcript_19633/g.58389  ORF Transcript_19633/g.58389 Transcript_19633/m.58389 type:complete len:120 (-) Transcript_19633:68-427(-)
MFAARRLASSARALSAARALSSSKKALVPLGDRVLVKKAEAQEMTAGGVFLPDAGDVKVNEADVVAVGPGAMDDSGKLLPMEVAVGDCVLLPDYGPMKVEVNGEELYLLRAGDILGKFQ